MSIFPSRLGSRGADPVGDNERDAIQKFRAEVAEIADALDVRGIETGNPKDMKAAMLLRILLAQSITNERLTAIASLMAPTQH
jgi:hypothetical protein